MTSDTGITMAGGQSGSFYATGGCGGGTVSSATISNGGSYASLFYKNNTAQTVTLNTSSGSYTQGTQVVTINPAAPTVLAMSGVTSLTAGVCSSTSMTMTTKDAYGNVSNVGGNKSLTLSGAQNGFFYGTAGCGAGTISSITVLNGQSVANFYYKNNTAQTVTLAADAGGFSQGNLIFTVAPALADTLVMSGDSPLTAGNCSANAYTIVTKDAYGNVSNVSGNSAVTLSGSGAGGFYGTAGCGAGTISSVTVLNGQATTSFYYKNTAAQTVTLLGNRGGFAQGSKPVGINPAALSALKLSGPVSSVTVAACAATYTVTSGDAYGNPLNVGSDTPVTLLGGYTGSYYATPGCGGGAITVVTIANATLSKEFYYGLTGIGAVTMRSVTITAATSPSLSGSNLTVSMVSDVPNKLSSTGATTVTAASCTTRSLQVKDQYNNYSDVASDTAISLASGTGNMTFYELADSTCTGSTITVVTLSAGGHIRNFNAKTNVAETSPYIATATGLVGTTYNLTVV
ncbi:MAG: hypothetical protein AAB425_14585, partial [Bdellovibrionota bacterium]